jgi:hypothetical protein
LNGKARYLVPGQVAGALAAFLQGQDGRQID